MKIRGYNPYRFWTWDQWFDYQLKIRASQFKEELFQMRMRALREVHAMLRSPR